MNLEYQHVLCEIEKLIAVYRDEIKLLAADGRNCDIVMAPYCLREGDNTAYEGRVI